MPEAERPGLVDEQPPRDRPLDIVEHSDDRTMQHRREQIQIETRTDDRGAAQRGRGRLAQLVAPGRHDLHQRLRQLRRALARGQLGEKERVTMGQLIQRVDP